MAPELTPSLLAEPAQYAVRVIANARVAQLQKAYDEFVADESVGVHDVRVALRRLRSWLRAFRAEVKDTLRTKTRRRLEKLAHSTNPGRDAEVAAEWIAAQEMTVPRERTGQRSAQQQFERERDRELGDARNAIKQRLPGLLSSLSKELEEFTVRHDVADPHGVKTMADVTRGVLTDHAERLAHAVSRVDSGNDAHQLHRVRIAAKRLRYVLEVITTDPAAATLVKRLTALQDLLGHAHDVHLIAHCLVREMGERAARDARRTALAAMQLQDDDPAKDPSFSRVRTGMTMLAVRASDEERQAYESFARSWRGRQIKAIITAVAAIADSLGTAGTTTEPPRIHLERDGLASA